MTEQETTKPTRQATKWSVGRIEDGSIIPVTIAVGNKDETIAEARKFAAKCVGEHFTVYRQGEVIHAQEETRTRIVVS